MSWIKATLIRVIRTGAQVALASIGAAAVFSEVAWDQVVGATGLGMVITFLTCLAGLPETPERAPLERAPVPGDGGAVETVVCALLCLFAFIIGWIAHAQGLFA